MEPRSFKRGNSGLQGAGEKREAGFDGATLIQAWKLPHKFDTAALLKAASMEPRSFKRGND